MTDCWNGILEDRPSFSEIRKKLAAQLEAITDEYSYLKLDAQKEYYQLNASTDRSALSTSPLSQRTENISLQPTPSDASSSADSGAVLTTKGI